MWWYHPQYKKSQTYNIQYITIWHSSWRYIIALKQTNNTKWYRHHQDLLTSMFIYWRLGCVPLLFTFQKNGGSDNSEIFKISWSVFPYMVVFTLLHKVWIPPGHPSTSGNRSFVYFSNIGDSGSEILKLCEGEFCLLSIFLIRKSTFYVLGVDPH